MPEETHAETGMTRGLSGWLITHRRFVAVVMLVLIVGAVIGHLPRNRFPRPAEGSNPQGRGPDRPASESDRLTNRFDLSRSEAFLVVEVDELFRREVIQALRAIEKHLESLPQVRTVFWIDDIPMLNRFGFADPLLPSDDAAESSFREARRRTLEHPLVVGQLISEDGRGLLLPVTFDWLMVTSDEDVSGGLLREARQEVARFLDDASPKNRPDIKIGLTGRVPIYLAQKSAFDRNQGLFRWIGYGMVFVLAVLMFRGLSAVLIVAAAPALGAFLSFGLIEIFDVPLNSLSNVVLPVLISMIGFTDGVHLMVHLRRLRAEGHSEERAAELAMQRIGPACWLTSLTTAIGFGSLLLADSEFVQDFGKACSIGVLVTFLAVILFIPLICSTRLGHRIHHGHERDIVSRLVTSWRGVIRSVLQHRYPVGCIGIAITLVLGLNALRLRPDSRLANSMPASSPAYRTLARCDELFGGIEFVQAVVHWPESLAADSPLILDAVHEVEQLVESEPLLRHPLSIRNMLDTFPGDPADRATRMTFVSLIPSGLRQFFLRTDSDEAPIVLRIQDRGIAVYEPVFRRLEERMQQLEERFPGFEFQFRGDAVRRSRDLFQIVVDLSTSLITAAVIILIVLTAVYRSWRIGLISVIPNMFPLAVTASVLYFTGQPINIASVCAFVVCLGIAVDDTIHFLSRFLWELKRDGDVDAAIQRAFEGVATALIMTTVILVAGFGTVLMSDLPGHRIFAAMACSTIAAALLGDLIFLPALLSWGRQKRVPSD